MNSKTQALLRVHKSSYNSKGIIAFKSMCFGSGFLAVSIKIMDIVLSFACIANKCMYLEIFPF